eukprot:gene12120-biopygen13993
MGFSHVGFTGSHGISLGQMKTGAGCHSLARRLGASRAGTRQGPHLAGADLQGQSDGAIDPATQAVANDPANGLVLRTCVGISSLLPRTKQTEVRLEKNRHSAASTVVGLQHSEVHIKVVQQSPAHKGRSGWRGGPRHRPRSLGVADGGLASGDEGVRQSMGTLITWSLLGG